MLFLSAIVLVLLGDACKLGGKEGDQCNSLILQAEGEDNCNAGFVCKPFSCSASYCCPKNGTSSDPNCNGEGCPDQDAGEEGGADAGEEGAQTGSEAGSEAAADAGVDAPSDAAISDGADGG